MVENELVLKQRNSFGFNTQIKLIDGRELQVIRKRKKVEQMYSVDILSLQEKSRQTIFIAWKWFIAFVGLLFLTLLLLKVLPAYLNENKNFYLAFILILGFFGSFFCVFNCFKYSSILRIFYSKNANIPIITLNKGKPSKEKFETFIDKVEKRINKFQTHMELDEDKQLVGEMKMLRRLSNDGVISKKSYESAKKELFNSFDSKMMDKNNSV